MAPEFHAFLSYSRSDTAHAVAIKERLEQRGLRVFLDRDDIFAGDRWQDALERRAADAACAIILLGSGGLVNWQKAEVELFLAENRRRQMRLIPVLLPGASEPAGFLAQHNFVDLRDRISEEGIRSIEFAVTQRRERFAHRSLVVHPGSAQSAAWMDGVVRPVCEALDVDVQLPGTTYPTAWHGVQLTDFVIADLSESDPHTLYVLGLCHAASRPVIAVNRGVPLPSDIALGNVGLIRAGASVDQDRETLRAAILRLRTDPSAGNALPRVGLFQQLKLIRSTYRDDRRALRLAARWFRQLDESLTDQIRSRRIRIEVSDFDHVRDWLFEYLEPGDQILATCFTDMSEFYYRRGVGTEYFKLNAAAIRHRNASMHRILEVPNDVWQRIDILRRELVDMYIDLDCRVSVVRAADLNAHQTLRRRDDFLLIVDAEGRPRAAIDFELDPSGVSSVAFEFSPGELGRKRSYFQQLQSLAAEQSRDSLRPRRTVDQMVATIADLSKAINNSNTVHYIIDASHSDDDIASYWMGLHGGLVRPLEAATREMRALLQQEIATRQIARFESALILGSTPEARLLAREFAHHTTVADISDVMYHAMSKVLERERQVAAPEAHEDFLLGEWRGMADCRPPFDLVLAFDSFNMLHGDDLKNLVDVLRRCTTPAAALVMQWAQVPESSYLAACRNGSTELTLRDAFAAVMRQRAQAPAGTDPDPLDLHEIFARLALSQFRTNDRRLQLRPVVDFLNTVVALDPASQALALTIQKTYALCNTTLFFHSQLQDGIGLRPIVQRRVPSDPDRWPTLFSVGKFALH